MSTLSQMMFDFLGLFLLGVGLISGALSAIGVFFAISYLFDRKIPGKDKLILVPVAAALTVWASFVTYWFIGWGVLYLTH